MNSRTSKLIKNYLIVNDKLNYHKDHRGKFQLIGKVNLRKFKKFWLSLGSKAKATQTEIMEDEISRNLPKLKAHLKIEEQIDEVVKKEVLVDFSPKAYPSFFKSLKNVFVSSYRVVRALNKILWAWVWAQPKKKPSF